MTDERTAQDVFAQFASQIARNPHTLARLHELMKDADRRQAISARIKELRERRGLTQPQVATALDVSLRTYQNWEAGGGTSGEHYERLAELLGVSYDYLMTGGEMMPPTADVLSRLDRLQRDVAEILDRLELQDAERELDAPDRARGQERPRPGRATSTRKRANQNS